jgi:hypothetical protein
LGKWDKTGIALAGWRGAEVENKTDIRTINTFQLLEDASWKRRRYEYQRKLDSIYSGMDRATPSEKSFGPFSHIRERSDKRR